MRDNPSIQQIHNHSCVIKSQNDLLPAVAADEDLKEVHPLIQNIFINFGLSIL